MTIAATVRVAGAAPYDVVVGRDLQAAAVTAVPDRAVRVAVLHAPFLAPQADDLAVAIGATGRTALVVELPDAEHAKTAAAAVTCWEQLGDAGFTRSDAVVGLGGGATTDLAGFVAGTWLRGVSVLHVPTTLLAMVDAAVGGKTGVNTTSGKNLVGVIHPPTAVVCDLDHLDTLPRPDLAAGMAEVVKAGFIADPVILDLIDRDPSAALDPHSDLLTELVERAIKVKAGVVGDDLTESLDRELGREILNYGHTLAHAIENVERYAWRHGDAVAVGLCYAAELSRRTQGLADDVAARHAAVLAALGLPTRYPHAGRWTELLAAMRVDKKARGATLRFVTLRALAQPTLLAAPDEQLLQDAFREVS